MLPALYLSLIAVLIQNSSGAIPLEKEYEYLLKYGYLGKGTNTSLISPEMFADALKKAQGFGNIPQTGQLDEQTKKYLNQPRCEIPDYDEKKFGGRWDKDQKNISYCFSHMTYNLSKSDILIESKKALKRWGKHSGHSFHYVPNAREGCDITIGFFKGAHGDGMPFDFEGPLIAHATYPPASEVHLDESEKFSIIKSSEADVIQLYPVMLHLFGHSMGLTHSDVKGSIMSPNTDTYKDLSKSDIKNVKELYGKDKKRIPVTTTSRRPKSVIF